MHFLIDDMIKDKILSFKELSEGQNYSEGVLFEDNIIHKALTSLKIIPDYYKVNAFPGIGGEIQLSICKDIKSLEITIESDESLTIVCEINNQEIFCKENLTLEETKKQIINFCKLK